jgi:hypothetical protein
VECVNNFTYFGNLESGACVYFDSSFTRTSSGEVPVSIVVSYEDASGEVMEETRDFTLNVMEPMMPEDMEGEEAEQPPMDMKKAMISIALLALLAMGLFVFVKRQKQEPNNSFSESKDDLNDDEDDDREDMSL